jgi:large subunit ribosomal protein L3
VDGILGKKLGMTQIYMEDGTAVPVTVVQAGPCLVVQRKTAGEDGYEAVQLGLVEEGRKVRVGQPREGHFKKAGVAPMRFLREERLTAPAEASVGDVVTAEAFSEGDVVDVIGTTKGRGFAGTIKRHGFSRGPETHGPMNVRAPGSIASRRLGKPPKGKRMAGHYGVARQTTKNLRIVRVDTERGLLFIKGAVPGPNGGMVQVRTARTARKRQEAS